MFRIATHLRDVLDGDIKPDQFLYALGGRVSRDAGGAEQTVENRRAPVRRLVLTDFGFAGDEKTASGAGPRATTKVEFPGMLGWPANGANTDIGCPAGITPLTGDPTYINLIILEMGVLRFNETLVVAPLKPGERMLDPYPDLADDSQKRVVALFTGVSGLDRDRWTRNVCSRYTNAYVERLGSNARLRGYSNVFEFSLDALLPSVDRGAATEPKPTSRRPSPRPEQKPASPTPRPAPAPHPVTERPTTTTARIYDSARVNSEEAELSRAWDRVITVFREQPADARRKQYARLATLAHPDRWSARPEKPDVAAIVASDTLRPLYAPLVKFAAGLARSEPGWSQPKLTAFFTSAFKRLADARGG